MSTTTGADVTRKRRDIVRIVDYNFRIPKSCMLGRFDISPFAFTDTYMYRKRQKSDHTNSRQGQTWRVKLPK